MPCGSDNDDNNIENVITSILNINLIRNTFKNIMDLIRKKIGVILFGETKLDDLMILRKTYNKRLTSSRRLTTT